MDTAKIKKKKKQEYYAQLYVNKFDNLEEMDNFLKSYSPQKMNEEKIDNVNRPITRSEIEYII